MPVPSFAVDVDGPFVLSHDAVDHGQPQAAPLAHLLGREEGLEDARQDVAGDSRAGVGNGEDDVRSGGQLELGGPEGFGE